MTGGGLAATRTGGVGAVAVAVALTTVAGLRGAVAGLAILAVWYALADLAAFGLAIVALGALRTPTLAGDGSLDPLTILAVAATLPLLVGEPLATDRPLGDVAVTLVFAVGLAIAALAATVAGESILAGAVTVVLVAAALSYGLHRYGMLVAGVLGDG